MEDQQRVRLAERVVASAVDALDPNAIAFRDATEVWKAFDRIERLGANAKMLLAARVEAAGSWRRAGARSAADHLAKLSGTSPTTARRILENSKELPGLPGISDALRAGALSNAQVDVIVPAATADPASEDRLLELAGITSVTELKDECLRTKAAADPDPDATHRRIHRLRRLRTHTDAEGAWNLSVRGTVEQGARFEAALEPLIDDLFDKARLEGRKEARETYAFDALMSFAGHDANAQLHRSPKPRYLGLLHVSFEAMARGAVEGEETCEIVGAGPIPVRVGRELLGDSILKLVITKGVDVVNVTHLGRGATAAQRIALLWAKPKCANVECSSMFVQIDHRIPWSTTKHTRLEELDPLCPHHHKLKTNQGWLLVEGTGRRAFVAPNDPRHPRNKPPP